MPRGEYLQYGGQAVLEGVMMRSPRFFSIACRAPNGQIVVKTESIDKTWAGKQKWLKLPFLRGSLALIDSMALGSRAMKFATGIQMDPEYAEPIPALDGIGAAESNYPRMPVQAGPSKRIQEGTIVATMVIAFAIGVGLFVYLPNLVAEAAGRATHQKSGTTINFVAELVKAAIFLGYIALIGQFKDIQEIFKYHGAEHKAINTLEADQSLEMENCRRQTRLHPRCGTSFAIIVLLLGLAFFPFVPRYPIHGHQTSNVFLDVTVRVLLEVAILPIISGIAYELLRLAGKFRSQAVVNFFFKPGVWTQFLTTREPESGQIEVALAALQAVIRAEDTGKVESEKPVILASKTVIAAS